MTGPLDVVSTPLVVLASEIHGRCGSSGYAAYHARRWAWNLKEVERLLPDPGEDRPRVLDIGRTEFTSLLEASIDGVVDSLGFEEARPTSGGRHIHFDLNDAQYEDRWLEVEVPYDVIIFAEVIEHLHTAPELVLAFLRTLLRPRGAMLLQTPNAVQLSSRLRMLAGRNPYHLISVDPGEPAHFREYTGAELEAICRAAGFELEQRSHQALFDHRYRVDSSGSHRTVPDAIGGRVRNFVYGRMPKALRPGLSLVLRRSEESP